MTTKNIAMYGDLDEAEYHRRVEYNTNIVLAEIKKHGFAGLYNILGRVYTATSAPGELHITHLIRGGYDIVPAVIIGMLPHIDLHGTDAIKFEFGDFVEIEFKWPTFKSDPFWVGGKKLGSIFRGQEDIPARRCAFTGSIVAQFNVHTEEGLATKKRKTILLVSDNTMPEMVALDIFELDAETTHSYISGTNNRGEKITTKKRTIKLGTFINKGTSIKHQSIVDDGIRFGDYEALLKENLPTIEEWHNGVRYSPTYDDLIS